MLNAAQSDNMVNLILFLRLREHKPNTAKVKNRDLVTSFFNFLILFQSNEQKRARIRIVNYIFYA